MPTSTGIYKADNTLITKRIEFAISIPDVIEVEQRLLNGQYHTQQIGTGATIVNVSAYLTMAQKLLVDSYKATGTPLKIIFDNISYTGTIKGAPNYERIIKNRFRISFTLLVNGVGA